MDFTLPAEVERFRDEFRYWLADHLTADIVAAGRVGADDPVAFATMRGWNRLLAEEGWAAVSWPVEFGGRGVGPLEQMVYLEETVRSRAPMPVNLIGMNNIAPAVMRYGTPRQHALLPRMVAADDIWCQGMSEPEAGSDLASLRTRAVRDGDHFVVTGRKIWTSLGHRADWCQLFARTDPDAPRRQGISCFLVDLTLPGVEAVAIPTLTGAADFAQLFFDEVRIPADAMLGTPGQGWQVATTTLSHERANAARLYSELRVRLEDLVSDLRSTPEGAAALGDPVTLRRLGELATRSGLLEVLCQRSISATLAGAETGSASPAKTVWGELGQDIAAFGFDLFGLDGAQGRWAGQRLSTRALTIAGGTTQINKNITAHHVLGLPRE
ncbi:acyl-CoA dehydrogenase [Nocardia nova SH22a]|uniref:Acyl-CoA dehydrogenase n=1 Tax=Nocardia nova SH22a TaxID=1415166 RepID=W5TEW0_9NOCA|nr:acyl-CoA dehydrogenase family protein [Nocardia nova]AHH17772.1 acyl-CoA dehydrogenase [Nocardia nova SH22a]